MRCYGDESRARQPGKPAGEAQRFGRAGTIKTALDHLDGCINVGSPRRMNHDRPDSHAVRSHIATTSPSIAKREVAPRAALGRSPSAISGRWVTPTVGRPKTAPS